MRLSVSSRKHSLETAKAIYDFLTRAVVAEYGEAGKDMFAKLEHFPIADSFSNILENKKDFVLDTDNPYDQNVKATMTRRGTYGVDLRDNPHWTFDQNCARPAIRGIWLLPGHQNGDPGINTFLHEDWLKIDTKTKKKLARIFVVKSCTDGDIEHVIQRIREHLP